MPQRITESTVRVLEAALAAPTHEWYGLELMDETGLKSGTLYPILHRLTADGWLTARFEDVDPAQVGRPRRRLYCLSGDSVPAAVEVVERWRLRRERPAAAKRPAVRRPGLVSA